MRTIKGLLFALLIACVGCGQGEFSKRGDAAGDDGALRLSMSANPTTLDPAIVQDIETIELLSNIYEPLVGYDENNQVRGRLADSWTTEDGGLTVIIKLRPNVKFHDGQTLTADDVKASLERATDPKLNSPTAETYLGDIVGAAERMAGQSADIRGLTVVDPLTIKISLDQPRPYFVGKLSYPCAFILPKGKAQPAEIARPEDAVGTGPFRLAKLMPDVQVDLAAFTDYHGGAPKVPAIQRMIIKDAATRLSKFKAGDLDLLGLQRQDIPNVTQDPELKPRLEYQNRAAVFYLGINPRRYEPFTDLRVRRAFVLGIDRESLCRDVLQGVQPAYSLIPPGIAGYEEKPAKLDTNAEEAKRLLAEAGFPGGKGLPELTIYLRDQAPDAQLIGSTVAGQLERLGWHIKLRTMEWRSYLTAANRHEFGMAIQSWYADYLDPQNFLSTMLLSDAKLNRDQYSNPRVDALLRRADTAVDENRRIADYMVANFLLLEDVARIPIYYVREAVLKGPRLKSMKSNLFGPLPHVETELN